ncbi:MAG: hypothetical protein KF833_06865 [Verrucomicrobiae bacterium]|nr:hypothetical protein [Verrucomicrobiae bacterium]
MNSSKVEPATAMDAKGRRRAGAARIHPVVIYPYRQGEDFRDLEALYEMIEGLDANRETYQRPITVMDRKTFHRMAGDRRFEAFRRDVVAAHSDILDGWFVDTCQMWYAGLGMAWERGGGRDVYWLIPGDFDYGSPVGGHVLGRLHELPEICCELGQDLCIGEIETEPSHPKQLIDGHGTFGLLYTWFPGEAREIRSYTERPRSEFFAVGHAFLGEMLKRRWYAYEQTMVMLLHAVFGGRRITRFSVGNLSDLPEGRESLTSAIQQVERTERVLKSLWRERHGARTAWSEQYRRLEEQSEHVRKAALTVLENVLGSEPRRKRRSGGPVVAVIRGGKS